MKCLTHPEKFRFQVIRPFGVAAFMNYRPPFHILNGALFMINYRLTFRARIKQEDGSIKLFYQGDQYLTSFLRRVSSFLYLHNSADGDDSDGKHEAYLEQTVDEVLDQCTGVKDENGKYIFEGDILKDKNGVIFQVFFQDNGNLPGFARTRLDGGEDILIENDWLIIGNIWENPELLNELKNAT